MTDSRRSLLHAAVAAGGASAVLMSSAVNGSPRDLPIAASESLEPLLRAVLHTIEAATGMPGGSQRAELHDVIADFLELPPIGKPGRCRICGCTEMAACTESADGEWFGPCGWADESQMLCDNPDCVATASQAAGVAAQ